MSETISPEFPYVSKWIEVCGSKLHYIDEGQGSPILFLHGVPTSAYLWRNIVAGLKDNYRCIAVDLIGFGQSEKPEIQYTIFDHIQYIHAFIKALNLKSLTIVMHGWGSLIGFEYAMKHPNNVQGLVFMEAHIRSADSPDMLSLPVQELASVLTGSDGGFDLIMNSNYFLNKVLSAGVLRRLSDKEMAVYQEPFLQPGTARPIWQYLQELPLGDGETKVTQLIKAYSHFLTSSNIPKLMLYAIPGFTTTIDTVIWARDNLPNLTLIDIGDGLHYIQESEPTLIAEAIAEWYEALFRQVQKNKQKENID